MCTPNELVPDELPWYDNLGVDLECSGGVLGVFLRVLKVFWGGSPRIPLEHPWNTSKTMPEHAQNTPRSTPIYCARRPNHWSRCNCMPKCRFGSCMVGPESPGSLSSLTPKGSAMGAPTLSWAIGPMTFYTSADAPVPWSAPCTLPRDARSIDSVATIFQNYGLGCQANPGRPQRPFGPLAPPERQMEVGAR